MGMIHAQQREFDALWPRRRQQVAVIGFADQADIARAALEPDEIWANVAKRCQRVGLPSNAAAANPATKSGFSRCFN